MTSSDRPNIDERVRERLCDVPRLLGLRRALREAGDDPAPRARLLAGHPIGDGTRVALLPGSFNPPTSAHLALAQAGLAAGADAVLFALATRTVDKETVTGAALEDRVLLLELLAARDGRLGVLVVNRGLYVDQAAAVRAAFPRVGDVAFVVGHDKIVQIFDPRYYDDRDAALERLFGLARFLVAPRADAGPDELAALLDRPENRRFARAVRPLSLPTRLRDVSSSAARAGEAQADALPPESRAFMAATGAYAPPPTAHSYRHRLALLDALEADAASGADVQARLRAALGE